MKLSVVLPCHNEADVLPELHRRLRCVLGGLPVDWEIILVDDGSLDDTWKAMRAISDVDPGVRAIRLSRNFGHQFALTAGMELAEGDAVITMDSDLQHPPEMIPEMLRVAGSGADVVYAVRTSRDAEGWFKVQSARFFYWCINRLTSLNLPHGGADFRYMSRRSVDVLLGMPEHGRFLRGMTRWVGFEQAVIEYDRAPRTTGEPKYKMRHMVRFALDAIVGFSALPLQIATLIGFAVSLLGFAYLIYVFAIAIAGTTVPGWTSVIVVALLLGGVQLICIGMIGQYVGRMYEESKGRPLFVIAEDTRQEREAPAAASSKDPVRTEAGAGEAITGPSPVSA